MRSLAQLFTEQSLILDMGRKGMIFRKGLQSSIGEPLDCHQVECVGQPAQIPDDISIRIIKTMNVTRATDRPTNRPNDLQFVVLECSAPLKQQQNSEKHSQQWQQMNDFSKDYPLEYILSGECQKRELTTQSIGPRTKTSNEPTEIPCVATLLNVISRCICQVLVSKELAKQK